MNFRNNSSKCTFNNSGYCKYSDSCRKQHAVEKCKESNCDQECTRRHPRECNRGESCKFLRRKICAYDHDKPSKDEVKETHDQDIRGIEIKVKKDLENSVNGIEKRLMKELNDIKTLFEKQTKDIEDLTTENRNKSKELNKKFKEVEVYKFVFIEHYKTIQ